MPQNVIELPSGWRTRKYQDNLWNYLNNGGKRAIVLWHRRAGKDDVALHWTATAAMRRPGNYWHMLPEAAQARKAVWDAVNPHTGKRRIDEAFPHQIRKTTREHEMMIPMINGATWQIVGSDNFNSLVGSPPVGVVFSEWALARPEAWAYLRPILAENGGWALFISSVRGRNHAYKMYEQARHDHEWFAELLSVDSTGVISKERLDKELEEYQRDYGVAHGLQLFRQEYYCSPEAAIIGSYYAAEIHQAEEQGRITAVPHYPGIKVETWWDLGIGDTTAIWFAQRVGPEIHLIDYHEENGHGLAHYAAVLQRKQQEFGYVYGEHVWPHDGGHKQLATGETLADTFGKLGFYPSVLERADIGPGIDTVRNMLARCWFDEDRCERGLEALRNYRAEWDDKKSTFKPHPVHDWASHGSDSFRYGCMFQPRRGNWSKPLKYNVARGYV